MLFNDKTKRLDKGLHIKDITIQVTGNCNLDCTYCYLHHKNSRMLNIEYGKKFIDKIVSDDQTFWNGYLDFTEIRGIQLQFIGGEPMVNYKAIIELCEYYLECCKVYDKMDLYDNTTFGICTNGTIYNEEIAGFLRKFRGKVDLAISIDGNKQLHDTCRRFKGSGKPTYDIVVENLKKYRALMPKCRPINTKATISPDNLPYIYDSCVNFFDVLKFNKVPMNCIHEADWTVEHAKMLYQQLKKVADYFLEKDYKIQSMTMVSNQGPAKELGFFSEHFFCFNDLRDNDKSWCGGSGKMLFLQYDGKIYNCNRYSETAMGDKSKDLTIGDIHRGVVEKENIQLMRSACYATMYDEECRNCPISKGCADCLAYCFERYGEFKKVKTLCHMHKARCLANVYFWNKYYIKHHEERVMLLNLPLRDAKNYVDTNELEMILNLSNRRYIEKLEEWRNQDEAYQNNQTEE